MLVSTLYRLYDNRHAVLRCWRRSAACWLLLLSLQPVVAVASDDDSDNWVEERISPSTEWVERAFIPFTRWMEKAIQDPQPDLPEQSFVTDVPSPLPQGVIPPTEAARLLGLLHKGKVLRVHWVEATPPAYLLRMLTKAGRIDVFYMNARDGTLLEQAPQPITETGEFDESSDR
ncbi:hypothetical protein [Bacterioplanes sanyensis]|uniref:hypothetical protein n=1 Tax=Bacterioplanes sanyensis TaxID=1249553 RepID=UPI0012FE65C7|nr:hypothetical protein [Bacterioplanes sanyensis]